MRNERTRAERGCRQPSTANLSDGNTRSLGVHSSRNIHRRQLLEEQLGRIGNVHLRDPRLVLTRPTLECILLKIPDVKVSVGFNSALTSLVNKRNLRNRSHQPTDITYVHPERIRHLE